ncbi:hypothetical protein EON68_04250 [archaeon]|nr:MAG: hypothetical protein EON68_04250 [archaeon]
MAGESLHLATLRNALATKLEAESAEVVELRQQLTHVSSELEASRTALSSKVSEVAALREQLRMLTQTIMSLLHHTEPILFQNARLPPGREWDVTLDAATPVEPSKAATTLSVAEVLTHFDTWLSVHEARLTQTAPK